MLNDDDTLLFSADAGRLREERADFWVGDDDGFLRAGFLFVVFPTFAHMLPAGCVAELDAETPTSPRPLPERMRPGTPRRMKRSGSASMTSADFSVRT